MLFDNKYKKNLINLYDIYYFPIANIDNFTRDCLNSHQYCNDFYPDKIKNIRK